MNQILISPNKPLFVRLQDPNDPDSYDFTVECGRYQTTDGQILTLPRTAVIQLNELSPAPGEEIVIQQHWSGRNSDPRRWTVQLSTRSELARAEAGEPDTLTKQLEASIAQAEERKAATPIRTPKREPAKETAQPRLFDHRGTGTDGPAPVVQPQAIPVPAVAIGKSSKPGQIPANVAVKEILAFIAIDPNTLNWGDQAKQDLASTVIIAAYKAGHIGLWERNQ